MVAVLGMATAGILPDTRFSNPTTPIKAEAEATTSEESFALFKRRLLRMRLSTRRSDNSVSALAPPSLLPHVYSSFLSALSLSPGVAKIHAAALHQFLQVYRC